MNPLVKRGLLPLAVAGALVAATPAAAQERALELVSPVESEGRNVDALGVGSWGALDGVHAYFTDAEIPAEIKTGSRTGTGWTHGSFPAQGVNVGTTVIAAAPDLSRVVVKNATPFVVGGFTEGLYLHRGSAVTPIDTWISRGSGDPEPPQSEYVSGSEELSTLVVRADDTAQPGPQSNTKLYRWRDGSVEPINADASRYAGATCGTSAIYNVPVRLNGQTAVSDDGRTVVLSTPSCFIPGTPNTPVPSHIQVWRDGTAVDISTPLAGEADGSATFVGMSRDGARVFFTTNAKLVASDTNGSNDLYLWENGSPTRLSDGEPAAGVPGVSGSNAQVSPDGATLWFSATQPLDGTGEAGKQNVWRWSGGERTFVGTFENNTVRFTVDESTFGSSQSGMLSHDGSALAFTASRDPETGANFGGQRQIFRLTEAGDLTCVSCQNGTPTPEAASFGEVPFDMDGNMATPRISQDGSLVAFQTAAALDPRDVNGVVDVYAWEGGKHTLISSGTEPIDSLFHGMSWDGRSIFFVSSGALLPGTTDTYRKMYVSRVGGGFPIPQPPEPCGAACQGPLTPPPALAIAASVSFVGPGNVPPPASRSVKKDESSKDEKSKPKVTKRSKAVRGKTTLVRVKVPSAGEIRISGKRIREASREVRKAGTYRVRIRLTKHFQRSLARRGKLAVGLRIRFAPDEGDAHSQTVRLQFRRSAKQSLRAKRKAARKAAARRKFAARKAAR